MPATLRSISGKVAEIQIYLGDENIPVDERDPNDFFTLRYRQHNITAKVERTANEMTKEGRDLEALVDLCLPVFVKWDLKPGATDEQMERLEAANDAGDNAAINKIVDEIKETVDEQAPIPITKEDLIEYVPSSVLMLILTQINESRNPNSNGTGKSSRKR